VGTVPLLWVVGEDFFPTVDAGLMKLHVRAPTGTRIERTELLVDDVERSIRQIIPADELEGISDNIDVPISYDLAFYQTDNIGPQDGEILIQLKPKHHPTAAYEQRIRQMLRTEYPSVVGYFQAADIVNQVLNFGLPAAIDVQVIGNDLNWIPPSRTGFNRRWR
jgi:multidrug efflux pump subunit AcrB